MRAFISVNLPSEIRKEIARVQELLKSKKLFIGKFSEAENLHLTLKFLGEIDERLVEKVKKRLGRIKVGELEAGVDSLGVFSEEFIRIIWVKLNGAESLQKSVDSCLKELFRPENRFMSHVTLARVKQVPNKKELLDFLKKTNLQAGKFRIAEFYLMSSELTSSGPVYRVLEKYPLSG